MLSMAMVVWLAQAPDGGGGIADWRDVAHLDALGLRYDAAIVRKDEAALKAMDTELRTLLKRELTMMRARADEDSATLKKPSKEKDGGVDMRKRDARQDMRIGGRLFEIDNELAVLGGKIDQLSLERRRALLDQIVGLAEQQRRREMREKKLDSGGE